MAVISGTGSVELPQGHVLEGLTIYGACAQDGTPTPDNPVEIKRITSLALSTSDGQTVEIDLQGHELAGLPDGTRDVLNVYRDGRVELVKNVGSVSKAIADMNNSADWPGWNNSGIRAIVGGGVNTNFNYPNAMSNIKRGNGVFGANTINSGSDGLFLTRTYHGKTAAEWKEQYPDLVVTIYAKYAEPLTIDLGYVELPDVRDASTLSVIADVEPEIEVSTSEYSIAGGVLR